MFQKLRDVYKREFRVPMYFLFQNVEYLVVWDCIVDGYNLPIIPVQNLRRTFQGDFKVSLEHCAPLLP